MLSRNNNPNVNTDLSIESNSSSGIDKSRNISVRSSPTSPSSDPELRQPLSSSAKKKKGGRTPIYATSEERKQRNRQAQAAFRERRSEYIKQLEATVKQNEETIQFLQNNHRSVSDECILLRYRISMLEQILIERGLDIQPFTQARPAATSSNIPLPSHALVASTLPSDVSTLPDSDRNQQRRRPSVPHINHPSPAHHPINPVAATPTAPVVHQTYPTPQSNVYRPVPAGPVGLHQMSFLESGSILQSQPNLLDSFPPPQSLTQSQQQSPAHLSTPRHFGQRHQSKVDYSTNISSIDSIPRDLNRDISSYYEAGVLGDLCQTGVNQEQPQTLKPDQAKRQDLTGDSQSNQQAYMDLYGRNLQR